jgi:uncharacterized cupredoxin-like copper-binding protein
MNKSLTPLVILITLFLAACGPGNGASTSINIELNDFSFTPNQFTLPAGTEITVHATNEGSVEHNFVIMKLGTDAGREFDDEDQPNVYWEAEIQAGDSQTFTFTTPGQPGVYQILCDIPGHLQAGMFGTVTVVK